MRLLMNPAPVEGGGNPVPVPSPTPEPKVEDKGLDLVKAVEGLVAKHGDTTAALRVLLGENYSYRDQIRDLKAKVPGGEDVVLKGEEAKHWGSYRALGKPADLKAALDEGATAKTEAGTYRREKLTATSARLTKVDGSALDPEVLGTLADKLDLVLDDLKDDKGVLIGEDGKPLPKDGTPVKAAFVKGEGDKLTNLAVYVKANWAKFLPSLKVSGTTQEKPRGTPSIAPRQGQRDASNQQREAPTRRLPTF